MPTDTIPATAEDALAATIDREGLRAQARLASAQGVLLWALLQALQPRGRDQLSHAWAERQLEWAVRACVRAARSLMPELDEPTEK